MDIWHAQNRLKIYAQLKDAQINATEMEYALEENAYVVRVIQESLALR